MLKHWTPRREWQDTSLSHQTSPIFGLPLFNTANNFAKVSSVTMSQFESNVKTFFKKADKDGSGCLSPLELYQVLLCSGFKGTADDVQSWFDGFDVNDDNKVTLEELLQQLCKRDPKSVEETELRAQFKKFDKDGSGHITAAELQDVLTKFGKKGKAEKYISTVDTDRDGKINYEEFLKMWKEDK